MSNPTDNVKLCPECGDEYTLQASDCADCRVPLVLPSQLEQAPPPEAFPEVDELECVRVGPIAWTRALSTVLEQGQIRHRVEPDNRTPEEGGADRREFDGADVFGTWVMPDDLERAKQLDAEVFVHIIGQQADAPEAAEDEVCPACQTPLAVDALECPDCGLAFN
ncbi:MAG: hypothetical protein QF570_10615 [Myxococcota bacterium]|jgi:hypothetical protein|nr:hypothetical protein [Myxococcota bacterium]